jgi:hypothetical protein
VAAAPGRLAARAPSFNFMPHQKSCAVIQGRLILGFIIAAAPLEIDLSTFTRWGLGERETAQIHLIGAIQLLRLSCPVTATLLICCGKDGCHAK